MMSGRSEVSFRSYTGAKRIDRQIPASLEQIFNNKVELLFVRLLLLSRSYTIIYEPHEIVIMTLVDGKPCKRSTLPDFLITDFETQRKLYLEVTVRGRSDNAKQNQAEIMRLAKLPYAQLYLSRELVMMQAVLETNDSSKVKDYIDKLIKEAGFKINY